MRMSSALLLFLMSLGGVAWGQQISFVDTRLLLLAHPLFRQFSAETCRFSGTPSEPVRDGEAGIKRIESELAVVRQKHAGLPAAWAQRLAAKQSPGKRKATEEAFIAEQKKLAECVRMLEERLIQLRGVPGRPGLTLNISMIGQVNTIARDIRAAISRVKAGSPGPVIDISPLMPDGTPTYASEVVYSNLNFQFWRAAFTPDENAVTWLDNAKRFLAAKHPLFLPVVHGGIDARLDAVKFLEQATGGR
ncbi:hypothetical protein KBA41_13930 [Candidatus Ozemobacteraceae bacterium]|nr:hypothetical protein [Candidatus Ozemobacteraceae bacterium]OQA05928.1 MAG: hypothetical protein BWY66_02165 [bacterium ADurb.Bin374]